MIMVVYNTQMKEVHVTTDVTVPIYEDLRTLGSIVAGLVVGRGDVLPHNPTRTTVVSKKQQQTTVFGSVYMYTHHFCCGRQ